MVRLLDNDEVANQLEGLDGWTLQDREIFKTYRFATFPAAISFVVHIGFLSEAMGHHPDIDVRYNRVMLALTTHDSGGLTTRDFELAAAIDALIL